MAYNRNDDRIVGKLVFSAVLTNTSPILIGKGEGEDADVEVMLWQDGTDIKKPYIPAASFFSGVKSFLKKRNVEIDKVDFEKFWGTEDAKKDTTFQSHLIPDELHLVENTSFKIATRDGVRIEYDTGIAANKGKYDYQLVEPGVAFLLKGEVTIRNGMDANFFKKMTATIKDVIEHEDFCIGALSNFGFGKVAIQENTWNASYFDFTIADNPHEKKWFAFLETDRGETKFNDETLKLDSTPFEIPPIPKFVIIAEFNVKSALIIGAYNSDPSAPDKSHLTSNGKHVLTAKSVKGALRHRAVKILNTLGLGGNDSFLKDAFGWVDNDGANNGKAKKSRFKIDEAELKGVSPMMQNRIKIDRFTGGVINGALFNSEPVWKSDNTRFSLVWTLYNYKDNEVALLLHLLKDLWTEDLAIGGEKNVGRGILQGHEAVLSWDGKTAKIEKSNIGITINGNKQELIEKFNTVRNTPATA